MAEYSANASKAFRFIVALPGGRGFFMRVFGKVLGLAFGKEQGYVNDMYECTHGQLGASELCQFFCRNDEVCYGHLDGIRFVRTGTLAKGADRCDFRIERV